MKVKQSKKAKVELSPKEVAETLVLVQQKYESILNNKKLNQPTKKTKAQLRAEGTARNKARKEEKIKLEAIKEISAKALKESRGEARAEKFAELRREKEEAKKKAKAEKEKAKEELLEALEKEKEEAKAEREKALAERRQQAIELKKVREELKAEREKVRIAKINAKATQLIEKSIKADLKAKEIKDATLLRIVRAEAHQQRKKAKAEREKAKAKRDLYFAEHEAEQKRILNEKLEKESELRYKTYLESKNRTENEILSFKYHLSERAINVLKTYFNLYKNIELGNSVASKDLFDINLYKLTNIANFNNNTILSIVKFLEFHNIPSTHEIDENGRLKVKPILINIDYSNIIEDTKPRISDYPNPSNGYRPMKRESGYTPTKRANEVRKSSTYRTTKEKLEALRIELINIK